MVVLMVAALGYAAVELIRPAGRRKDSASARASPAADGAELKAFAEAARASVMASRPQPVEVATIERAADPWAPTPFAVWTPSVATSAVAGAAAERTPDFRYTGFLSHGEIRFAILNGREYRVGDTVKPGDFTVRSIEPDRVTLAAGSGGRQVSIAKEKAELTKEEP